MRSGEKGKSVHQMAAEGQDIQPVSDATTCIIETMIEVEVAVDQSTWTEDVAETEETLIVTLRSRGVKEWRMDSLSMTVETRQT